MQERGVSRRFSNNSGFKQNFIAKNWLYIFFLRADNRNVSFGLIKI